MSLALDPVEVLARRLVLARASLAGQVAGDDHHVGLELVDLHDRPVEQARHEVRRAAVEVGEVRDREACYAHAASRRSASVDAAPRRPPRPRSAALTAGSRAPPATSCTRRMRAAASTPRPTAASVPGSRSGGRRRSARRRSPCARPRAAAADRARRAPAGGAGARSTRRRLGQVDAGVEHDLLLLHAELAGQRHPLTQRSRHVLHHVVVAGVAPSPSGGTRVWVITRRHRRRRRRPRPRDRQAAHVVDHAAPASSAARATAARQVSTETRSPSSRQPLDQRHDAGDLLLDAATGRAVGAPGLAADVDDRGALTPPARGPARRASTSGSGPPSENESGVALTIPMSRGALKRPPRATAPAQRQRSCAPRTAAAGRLARHEPLDARPARARRLARGGEAGIVPAELAGHRRGPRARLLGVRSRQRRGRRAVQAGCGAAGRRPSSAPARPGGEGASATEVGQLGADALGQSRRRCRQAQHVAPRRARSGAARCARLSASTPGTSGSRRGRSGMAEWDLVGAAGRLAALALDDPVDSQLGHPPPGGELAAGDRYEAGARSRIARPCARCPRDFFGSPVEISGRTPGVGAGEVVRRQLGTKERVDSLEQVSMSSAPAGMWSSGPS